MTQLAPEDLVANVLGRLVNERLEFLVVECSPYFVQFAAPYSAGQPLPPDGPLWGLYAEHGLYSEAVSDIYLEPEAQLGTEGAERLSRLGWTPPTDSNWTRLFELRGPEDCVVVAREVLATFVEGFHAAGELQYHDGDAIPSTGGAEQSEVTVPAAAMHADEPVAQPTAAEAVAPQATAAPAPSASSTRPASSRNVGGIVGIARSVAKGVGPYRGKPAALQVWTFRLETYDEADNPGPLLGVEMRGTEIVGTLENGDWVLITERVKPGEGCRPKEVQNLTTNERVRSKMHIFMAQ
jgi:hypothetical protein